MEIESDRKDEKLNKNGLDKLELKYISTDVIQQISNYKNNDFYDPVSLDIEKKQNFLIRNICFNKYGNNFIKKEDKFEGRPGDFLREEIRIKKLFIENQSSYFESDKSRVNTIKQHLLENNLRKLNKYINLVNLIKSKEFDSKMRNNLAFYRFIINNPILKILDEEVFKEILNKYSHLSIDIIKSQMKNNTGFKYSVNSYTNDDLSEEESEYHYSSDYGEIYDSGDEIV